MKKFLAILVSLSLLLTGLSGIVFTSHAAEEGTEENPYIVTTATEFAGMPRTNDCAGVWYELQADIVLPEDYAPFIFYGNLRGAEKADGSKYKITLNMTRDEAYAGVFSQIFGEISNIEICGSVSGTQNVGALAGSALAGSIISDCINSANVTSTLARVGGFVGLATGARIENCINKGNVTISVETSYYAGGIAGNVASGTVITGCSNEGDVTCNRAGGIAGYVTEAETLITLCRNSGTVTSYNGGGAGGIVSYMNAGTVSASYNCGTIVTPSLGGGICYNGVGGEIKDCFNASDMTASGGGGALSGILASGAAATTVSNCYNIGKITSNRMDRVYPIGDFTKTSVMINCYYAEPSSPYTNGTMAGTTSLTTEQWAELAETKTLPTGFSSDVWEYVEVGSGNTYPLPQLKGNRYTDGVFAAFEEGSKFNPIKVNTAEDFAKIASDPGKCYIQTANIENLTAPLTANFTGNYNGNGKYINVSLSATTDYLAPFSLVTGGTIENLTVKGTVSGGLYVGGIVGKSVGATVKSCINEAAITSTGNGAGGIMGYAYSAPATYIYNCKNYGTVKGGARYAGGIVGMNYDRAEGAKIELCANFGEISSATNGAGGIAGYLQVVDIVNTLNAGKVTTPTYGAGLVYDMRGGNVENCLNVADIETTSGVVAGLIASTGAVVNVKNSYNAGTLTGRAIYTYAIGSYGNYANVYENCYYVTSTASSIVAKAGVSEITDSQWIELIAENKLPTGFSSDVWEYVEISDSNSYPLPQLKGNGCPEATYDLPTVNNTDFGGGMGTSDYPYIVANETHLANISKYPSATYKQTADIENVTAPVSGVFSGDYNGNGFKVTLAIDKSDVSKVGLFGEANGATIENVTVNGFVNGNTYVGGIVGLGNATVIKNCVNNAEINSKGGRVGGIAGDLQTRGSEISNSVNNGSIYSSNSFCGGIIGVNGNHSIMDKLSNYGLVHGRDAVGGITGIAYSDLSNCVNAGEIIGNKYVGGIIGQIRASYGEDGTKYCLNLGTVYAYGNTASAFGVSGHTDYAIEFTNCINAGDVLSASDPGEALAWGGTTCTLNNCYYLTADETAEAVGTVVPVKSPEELKALTLEGFTDDANGYPALTANPTRNAVEFAVLDITLEGENGTFSPVGKRFALVGNKYTFRASADESYKLDILVNGSPVKENIRDAEEYSIVISGDTTVKAVVSVYVASVPEIRSFKTAFSAKENFYDPIRRKTFDKYAAVAAILYEAEGFEISEFGFALSKDAAEPTTADIKCKAEKREENGRFGVVIAGEGLVSGDKYYARPYVTYTDGTESVTVYGNALSFTVAE